VKPEPHQVRHRGGWQLYTLYFALRYSSPLISPPAFVRSVGSSQINVRVLSCSLILRASLFDRSGPGQGFKVSLQVIHSHPHMRRVIVGLLNITAPSSVATTTLAVSRGSASCRSSPVRTPSFAMLPTSRSHPSIAFLALSLRTGCASSDSTAVLRTGHPPATGGWVFGKAAKHVHEGEERL
jgi:hypothetical protein